jgi:hypothetical protein
MLSIYFCLKVVPQGEERVAGTTWLCKILGIAGEVLELPNTAW